MSGAEYVSPSRLLPLAVQAKEGAVLESDCLGFDWFLLFSTIGLVCTIVLLIIKHCISYLYVKKKSIR